MKRVRSVGCCLIAAFAITAVAAATASAAEAPEVGRCVKVAPGTGHFSANTCKKEEKPGKFGEYELSRGRSRTGSQGLAKKRRWKRWAR